MSKKKQKRAALAAGQVALLRAAADTIRAQKATLARLHQPVQRAARLAPKPQPRLDGYTMARLSAEMATMAREPVPSEHHDPRERLFSAASRDAALGAAYNEEIHIQKLWAPLGVSDRAPGDLGSRPHSY